MAEVSTRRTNSLEICIPDELNNNVFLRLNLQHFQYQTEEGCWFDVTAISATNIFQLHGFVHHELSWNEMTEW